jgi:thymidylate kinase
MSSEKTVPDRAADGAAVRAEIDDRPLTRRVLAALDDAGVTWALLRGSTGGGDVDVLVETSHLATTAAVLDGHGFLPLPAYGRGTHRFFLGLDTDTGSWVEFDVVTDLSFGRRTEFRTAAAPACLARRRRVDGVWVLRPEDEFWTLLLHCVLDKGGFADRHLRRVRALAASASWDSPLVRSLPPGVGRAALRGHRDALRGPAAAPAGPSIARAWWRAEPVAVARAYGSAAALRLVERPLQAWGRRGASVALLGPDGSGKSTLAAGLADRFYFPVRTVYMGLWPRAETPARPMRTVLAIARRPLLVWARYLAALRHRATGRLVVFDRYVYDALLPPRGTLTWLKRPYFAVLAHCCPAPRLVVLLDSPGDVMYARCGEYDPAHLDAERAAYLRIAARLPRVARVDSNRPADLVLGDVMGHVWRLYQDRRPR